MVALLSPLTQSKTCKTCSAFPLNKNQIINQLFNIENHISNLFFQAPIGTIYLNSGFHQQSQWAQHIAQNVNTKCLYIFPFSAKCKYYLSLSSLPVLPTYQVFDSPPSPIFLPAFSFSGLNAVI